jgi:hypothetical protein
VGSGVNLSWMTLFWGDFIVQQGEGRPCLGLRLLCKKNELQKEVMSFCMSMCKLKECDSWTSRSTSSHLG